MAVLNESRIISIPRVFTQSGSLLAGRNSTARPAAPKCNADDRQNLAATEIHQAAFAQEQPDGFR